jgi:hypothetical protein
MHTRAIARLGAWMAILCCGCGGGASNPAMPPSSDAAPNDASNDASDAAAADALPTGVHSFSNGAMVTIEPDSTQAFVPVYATLGLSMYTRACNPQTPAPGSYWTLSIGTVSPQGQPMRGDATLVISFDASKPPVVGTTYTAATNASLSNEFVPALLAFSVYSSGAGGNAYYGQTFQSLSITFTQVPTASSPMYSLDFRFVTTSGSILHGSVSGSHMDSSGQVDVGCG